MEAQVIEGELTIQQIEYWMKEALEEAKKGFKQDEIPVGCVFVRRIEGTLTKVVGSHNLTNQYKNASRHCQINCIYEMEKNLTKEEISSCILFVTVEPCIMCTHALNLMSISTVYFGQFNDKFGGCGSLRKDNTFFAKGGIMQKESFQLIHEFYERGNQRLPEQMRNRNRKKVKQNEM